MALKYARYGYVLENGRVVLDGEAEGAGRERGRQGVLSRHRRRQAQIVSRGQALPPPQALAGVIIVRPTARLDVVPAWVRRNAGHRGRISPRYVRATRPEVLQSRPQHADVMRDDHYDTLETRDPAERERDLLGRLPDLVALALSAPGWAAQLGGIEPNAMTSRAALAQLPVLRKSELAARQRAHPPFGGFNVTAPGRVRRLLMSPGPIFEPEGHGGGFLGRGARAVRGGHARRRHRAQLLRLSSHARRLHHGIGRPSLGCAVIPAGTGNTEQQVEAIAHLKPSGYLGTPDFLKILLDAAAKAGKDASSLQARPGFGRGAAGASLRQELAARGVMVLPVLCHRRARRHRLRERSASERDDRQRDPAARDRAARHRRSRRGGRGGRESSSPRSIRIIP